MALRRETLVESVPRDLDLDIGVAKALVATGRRLAAQRPLPATHDPDQASVIKCTMNPNGTWRVLVSDAVGLLTVGDLALAVEPKIPRAHLFYLFAHSQLFPRVDDMYAAAEAGADLWELLASWFLRALEPVVRRDLIKDYVPRRESLLAARGAVDALATADSYYSGRLQLVCDFEDFASDTPLNRLLRAAALAVVGSAELPALLRKRAAELTARMDGVGPLRQADFRVSLDRRTDHYRDALLFARSILMNVHRSIGHGAEAAWTFLIRTPELVESGVREALRERLENQWTITKTAIPLGGAAMTVTPDLAFGYGTAVADVKYKRAGRVWNRADLYEVVAFAEAAGTNRAGIIGFGDQSAATPPTVAVGAIEARYFMWPTWESNPTNAADCVANAIRHWLDPTHNGAEPTFAKASHGESREV